MNTFQSGFPAPITFGVDTTGTGIGSRPDILAGVKWNLPCDQRTCAHWFNTAAFAQVPVGTEGTAGRNIIDGPGLKNVDLGIFRDFNFTERFKLQFRAEAFNVSNTPLFNNPGATVTSATRNAAGEITNLGGYTEITGAAHTERQFRFALKLMF